MRKGNKGVPDADIRVEYDFASMTGGVRGKYAERYRAGVNLVLLEPEVAKAFPTADAVNQALRTVMRAAKASRRTHIVSSKQARRTRSAQAIEPRR